VDTLRFFAGLGLPLTEVWGLSETSGVLTANPPDDRRPETVGVPLDGAAVRIAEDGEVLARGAQLLTGYRGRPDLTAEAVVDGWLHTGDLGELDEDGYLTLTGRKKDIIINSSGKNMSPVAIENALKSAGPLIGQACVLGDGRRYNVALLVVDPDARRGGTARGCRGGGGGGERPALTRRTGATLARDGHRLGPRQRRTDPDDEAAPLPGGGQVQGARRRAVRVSGCRGGRAGRPGAAT
jgi:long-subunit acyl-CoA synthetase (AMP-forming)